MRTVFASALPAAVLGALVLAAGCRSETPPAPPETTAATETPTPSSAPVTRVEISGDDQMRYSTTAFTVAAGSEVTLVFQNAGQLPKETFGHNVVVLQSTADASTFAAEAMGAASTDYIPAGREADIVAHTRLLGPGETDTVVFTAPTTPGTYTYLCTYPGHGAIMRGTMTVVG